MKRARIQTDLTTRNRFGNKYIRALSIYKKYIFFKFFFFNNNDNDSITTIITVLTILFFSQNTYIVKTMAIVSSQTYLKHKQFDYTYEYKFRMHYRKLKSYRYIATNSSKSD